MNKKLHLIRHAKSSWDNPDLTDFQRPLNQRGRKNCKVMAEPIIKAGCSFENVFCSPAKRAEETIEQIASCLHQNSITWQKDEDLYTFSFNKLLSWCKNLDDNLSDVVVIGHNPALTQFCNVIALANLTNLPTCAYACINFDGGVSWRDLTEGIGTLEVLLTPKEYDL